MIRTPRDSRGRYWGDHGRRGAAEILRAVASAPDVPIERARELRGRARTMEWRDGWERERHSFSDRVPPPPVGWARW